jgi:hypothetical protein
MRRAPENAQPRVHGLVRLRREQEYPAGTLTLRYQLVHVLSQNPLDAALPPTRRQAWSGRLTRGGRPGSAGGQAAA